MIGIAGGDVHVFDGIEGDVKWIPRGRRVGRTKKLQSKKELAGSILWVSKGNGFVFECDADSEPICSLTTSQGFLLGKLSLSVPLYVCNRRTVRLHRLSNCSL